MKPEVPGARAQPLQPGVKYRLFVTDGSAKGQHDFQPVAKPAGHVINHSIRRRPCEPGYVRASIFVPAKWHDAK